MYKKLLFVFLCTVHTATIYAVVAPLDVLQEEAKKKDSDDLKSNMAQLQKSVEGIQRNQDQFSKILEFLKIQQTDISMGLKQIADRLEQLSRKEK